MCGVPTCVPAEAQARGEELGVRARPDPATDQEDHELWLQEYETWKDPNCPCGKGYWCAAHAIWVTGDEVSQGLATPKDAEVQRCPASHFTPGVNPAAAETRETPARSSAETSGSRNKRKGKTHAGTGGAGYDAVPGAYSAGSQQGDGSFEDAEDSATDPAMEVMQASPTMTNNAGYDTAAAQGAAEGSAQAQGFYSQGTSYHLLHEMGGYNYAAEAQPGDYWANENANAEQSGSDWMEAQDEHGDRGYYNSTTGEWR